jgi:hypothetical protein
MSDSDERTTAVQRSDERSTPQPAELLRQARDALAGLLSRDTRNTCQHENTHRGGVLWTICDDCDAKWADDRGGMPEWKDPPEWVRADEAIAALDAALAAVPAAPTAASPQPDLVQQFQDALLMPLRPGDEDAALREWQIRVIRAKDALRAALAAVPAAAQEPSDEQRQLMKFYGVDSLAALVDKQAHHIERLQAMLPPTPNVFAPQRVREG